MSNETTRRMIRAYNQVAAPVMFLAGFFQSPPENFHNSEEVEIDITRSGEDVAIVIQDISAGYRMNSADIFTNKSFKPPIFKEALPINSFDLIKRNAGENPFQDPNFRANLITRTYSSLQKVEAKIRRAIELQASQVLQTGIVTLANESGTTLYTLDYKPKATHFPTSGTTWGQAGDDKLGDIESLAAVIRADGLTDCNTLIFGSDALKAFLADTTVQAQLDNRRMNIGDIGRPVMSGAGGTYHGSISIGAYSYNIWTYTGRYKHPQTGTSTAYVDPGKVILLSSTSTRLDATFGNIPNIGKELGLTGASILPELPGRISNGMGGMDLHTNAWITPEGEQLFAGVGSRPLMIPTAIDTYGCLDTGL
jgi:hypothetical protein